MKNILDKFEEMVDKFPNKTLFATVDNSISYIEFKNRCRALATEIANRNLFNKPIAVEDNRDIETLVGMFGVVYSGNHYVLLDSLSPISRLEKICDVVNPSLIIHQTCNKELAKKLNANQINTQEVGTKVDDNLLKEMRFKTISTDLVYILFTSGSTGTPKGTAITHANLLNYIEWYSNTFKINENTIFASQTPFYFSASVSDLYSSIMYGATFNIIPKSYFSFPIQLVRFLNERKVNTIYWVPSALCIVANIDLFKYEKPQYLQKVLFAGEIMPNKQLNYWRRYLPDVMYANLFGPTETTDICTYYIVDRQFNDDDSLPIGKPCNNADTFILDENLQEISSPNKIGELYVRSPFVASGYYNNSQATSKAFIQNPLNTHYPETVYKTGDLVMLNELGEYLYCGRTDFQIKHKGYRIELGEIERVLGALDKIDTVAALYDKEADKIIVVYTGKLNKEELLTKAQAVLTNYMVPEEVVKLGSMPYNSNGKIDRKYLVANYKNL